MSEPDSYCRDLEAYLCRKNGGHLIRVVGPAFELVSGWASRGVPLAIACAGIDRYFDRQARRAQPRRRPVRIEFCDADVLDAFDEWRRATGASVEPRMPRAAAVRRASSAAVTVRETDVADAAAAPPESLAVHVEQVTAQLTRLRGRGPRPDLPAAALDRVVRTLDLLRARARHLSEDTRDALLAELAGLEQEMLREVAGAMSPPQRQTIERAASDELAAFKSRMAPPAFARAVEAAFLRRVREHTGLPRLARD